jgi:hypothetical protein
VLQGFTLRNGNPSFNNSYLGGGVSISGASPIITVNVITQNHGSNGAGISIQSRAPIIQSNTITGNMGEGIYVLGSSGSSTGPQIVGNVISNNTSGYFGAGIDLFASGPVLIQNNLIMGNQGPQGGGIGMANGSNPTIIQNVIVGNTGGTGGGFYSLVPSGATAYLLNNTVVSNSSPKGSAVYVDGNNAGIQIVNSILQASPGQGAVYCGNFNTTTTPLISFNDVVGAPGRNYEGLCSEQTGHNGNISADPLLDCPSGNNYPLAPGSPAIGAGNAAAAGLPTTDYDGNPRVMVGTGGGSSQLDIGAYEFQGPSVLDVSPPALSFGNQLVGTASAPQALSVQNTSSQTAWFCGFTLSNDFTEATTCADHLNAGASCNVRVTFTPSTQGSKSTVLGINANTTSSLQVSLSGTGVNPTPVLNSLSPASTATAGPSFTMNISGSGFVSNSAVLWNGSSRPTIFSSPTQLQASISMQDLAQPGAVQVTVSNPSPGGATSAAGIFTIANAVVNSGGVLNGASYTQAIVPGELVSVFGTNLSSSTNVARQLPLPTTLANTSVYLNDYSTPLFFVSPGQINFQVPWELAGLTSISLTVVTNGSPAVRSPSICQT